MLRLRGGEGRRRVTTINPNTPATIKRRKSLFIGSIVSQGKRCSRSVPRPDRPCACDVGPATAAPAFPRVSFMIQFDLELRLVMYVAMFAVRN